MLSSHIIFSSADLPAATTVVRLLEKASSHVPSSVKQLSVRAIEVIDWWFDVLFPIKHLTLVSVTSSKMFH